MTICHCVATNNELKYNQFLEKLGEQLRSDPSDFLALKILEMYNYCNFREIRDMVAIKQVRDFYNRAISYTI